MLTEEEVREIINAGESEIIERKQLYHIATKQQRAEFVKDMMALANAHGSEPRYLLLGVTDDGKLHDLSTASYDEATFRQIADGYIGPTLQYTFTKYQIDGSEIVVIKIPPSAKRFYMAIKPIQENSEFHLRKGDIFIRHGTSKGPLVPHDMERFRHSLLEADPKPELSLTFADHSIFRKEILRYAFEMNSGVRSPRILPANTELYIRNSGQTTARDVIIVEIQTPIGFAIDSVNAVSKSTKWKAKHDRNLPQKFTGANLLQGDTELIGLLSIRPNVINSAVPACVSVTVPYVIRTDGNGEFKGELSFELDLVEDPTCLDYPVRMFAVSRPKGIW